MVQDIAQNLGLGDFEERFRNLDQSKGTGSPLFQVTVDVVVGLAEGGEPAKVIGVKAQGSGQIGNCRDGRQIPGLGGAGGRLHSWLKAGYPAEVDFSRSPSSIKGGIVPNQARYLTNQRPPLMPQLSRQFSSDFSQPPGLLPQDERSGAFHHLLLSQRPGEEGFGKESESNGEAGQVW